jgi:hypothetical protein
MNLPTAPELLSLADPLAADTHTPAQRDLIVGLLRDLARPGGTPAADWRAQGQEDPHGTRYDCERAALCMGYLTDDDLANRVYLAPNIANLTAVKDRMRWLSRSLIEASKGLAPRLSSGEEAVRTILAGCDGMAGPVECLSRIATAMGMQHAVQRALNEWNQP